MRIFRVLLVCALLAGCGGDDEEQTATPAKTETPAAEKSATPAAQDEEAAVREVFDSYMAALKEKDFDTACSKLAPETTEKLQENVKKLGVSDPPETCPGEPRAAPGDGGEGRSEQEGARRALRHRGGRQHQGQRRGLGDHRLARDASRARNTGLSVRAQDRRGVEAGRCDKLSSRCRRRERIAELERDLAEAIERQSATGQVLEVLGRCAFELEPVFETVVAQAVRLCRADAGQIYVSDGDVYRLAVALGASQAYREYLASVPIAAGPGTIVGRVTQERQTVQIRDASADPEYTMRRALRARRLPHDARRADARRRARARRDRAVARRRSRRSTSGRSSW